MTPSSVLSTQERRRLVLVANQLHGTGDFSEDQYRLWLSVYHDNLKPLHRNVFFVAQFTILLLGVVAVIFSLTLCFINLP